MKTILPETNSTENQLVEEKNSPEGTSQSNFTSENTQEPHINNENLESWEKITQQIKENVFFR
jgi:hypothetical protein